MAQGIMRDIIIAVTPTILLAIVGYFFIINENHLKIQVLNLNIDRIETETKNIKKEISDKGTKSNNNEKLLHRLKQTCLI